MNSVFSPLGFNTLNEGRNFSSGNTAVVAADVNESNATLNEGRNFSSGNTAEAGAVSVTLRYRSMRAGTLVPATRVRQYLNSDTVTTLNEGRNFSSGNTRERERIIGIFRSPLNEGRNFSSGNTPAAPLSRVRVRGPLNEGRNFSSGNTKPDLDSLLTDLQRSMRAGTLVPATPPQQS